MPLLDLKAQLADLDWDDRAGSHARAAELLPAEIPAGTAVADLLASLDRRAVVSRSVEKTTHFKWFLGGDDDRFELWLHQYKPAAKRRVGHAVVAHNHRFWFTSMLLEGGFTSRTFDAERTSAGWDLRSKRDQELVAGATFIVDPDEIHALVAISDPAVSLLIQSKPIRSFSEVYEAGEKTRYYDLEHEFDALASGATSTHSPTR